MGFKIQSSPSPNYLYHFQISLSLIIFFILLSSSSSAAKPLLRRPNLPAHHRTTLHGGASTAPFKPRAAATPSKLQMEIKNKNKNKKITAGFRSNAKNKPTAFSVMLPKGFVPPSGSSPCHNENPESVAFYCHLSATNP